MLHQIQALIAPSSHLVMLYIIYIVYVRVYDKLVHGQSPDLQSRFPGVLSDVLPISNKILGKNNYSGPRAGPLSQRIGWG